MPATLVGGLGGDDDGRIHDHFKTGTESIHAPLTDSQKKMVRFTGRSFDSVIDRDHAISQKFGMTPVDYFRKLEEVKGHPGLSKKMNTRLQDMYAPTPGPQTGGAPIYAGKQFTHGTMW